MPARIVGSVYPIAAGDVFFSSPPVSAFAAAAINALPMWRKHIARQGLADLKARLHQGHSAFILFPEGSRSRTGEIQAFKAGVGMMVAGTPIPVVPCRLWGAFEALPPGGRLPRPRSLRASFGTPLTFADQPDNHDGWLAITARLREAVLAIQ